MADLDGLRKRVEQIDLRLKTTHRARENESAALMDMWEQIRARFVDQNVEITQLRNRVSDLEDTRDDLLQMVHGLLAAVEGGLEQMSDETVPRIKAMAGSLLEETIDTSTAPATAATKPKVDQQPQAERSRISKEEKAEGLSFHDDLLSAIERSIEGVKTGSAVGQGDPSDTVERRQSRPANEPVSPGIRDLVMRIENAVSSKYLDTPSDTEDSEMTEDDLSRDLREIEALRGELHGLRERISNGM